MRKLDKIQKYHEVKSLLMIFIAQAGAFDYWLDDYWLFPQVAQTANCSVRLVKKIFFKDLLVNHKKFVDAFEY